MTSRSKRRTLVLGAALGGLLATPVGALAEEQECIGAIGPVTVDNVRVPEGAACTMDGTLVQGTVKVERGATLEAQGIRVIGNVQGEGAANVTLRSSTVGGSVQVKQGGAAETTGSRVTGDIQYDQQSGPLRIADNVVNGSVQVVANRGGATIVTNTIDGNLQCKENLPPPTGGGNLVHGNAEDQCAALAGGPGAPASGNGGGSGGDDDGDDVTLRGAATRGATMVFRGRVREARAGVRVLLQVKRGDRWRSVDGDRTNGRGVYRMSHRFTRGARARTVQVRTLVRRQGGWPSRTTSDVLRLRIAAS
jgi:hypothetical protein